MSMTKIFLMFETKSFGNNFFIENFMEEVLILQYGKVVICGVDTSALPVLNETQKSELLKKTRQGDSFARDRLINGNLRLVLSVIKRFQGRGENPDDLFQIGCIGLIKAIDNFDITQNVRFSTYAVPMVIECRNSRKDFECYDQKNRITTGNFTTLSGPKEYGDL